jgi:hypothetical protein
MDTVMTVYEKKENMLQIWFPFTYTRLIMTVA